jgi:tartrate-resistant acid phosphatase type 5
MSSLCRSRAGSRQEITNRANRFCRLQVTQLEPRLLLAAPQFYSGRVLSNVQSSEISAASGIVASRANTGVLWTFNDGGDSRIFATDVKGRSLATFTTGVAIRDAEDIAIGPGPIAGGQYLYVADIGDNALIRSTIGIVRLAEPIVQPGQTPVTTTLSGVETLAFRYPDGPRNAETLIVDPSSGELYVITKSDLRNRIYRAAAPLATGTVTTLQFMGEMTWGGAVAGDISPDGSELIIKSLNTAYFYPRAAGMTISAALQAAPSILPYTTQQLGEGISFDADGWGYYTNSEGTNQPLYYYERVAAPTTGSFRFAVIGDYGWDNPNEDKVADLVKNWDPSFVITTGDNNYDVGSVATIDPNIGKYYSQFIGSYQGLYGPGASQNRFFPSLGNHDWVTAAAQPYLNYFALPGNERYYDYVKGSVHFFVVDSDPNEPSGRSSTSTQAQWLQSNLAASTSQFNVVYFHHSPYSSGSEHGSDPTMQWPFKQWGADVVLTGHDHDYERLNVNGLPYFVNGLGGRSIYTFSTPVAGSQARYNGNYGAQLVTVDASGMRFDFYSIDGVLRDSFTIPASQNPPPTQPITLIATGDTWKYLDTGVAPAAGWTGTSFSDTAWKSGKAEFGYGDGDEATIVSYGPSTNKFISTYFRKTIDIADVNQIGDLMLRLKRDDGAIVYLNGQEVVRSNMATGTVTSTTPARTAIGAPAESTFYSFRVDRNLLVRGTNVVAVEIHQSNRTSSDMSFDLELASIPPTTQPAETTFVATGAPWRYLDSGGSPGAAWKEATFNDSLWKTGRAQFGYGEGDEATVVSYGSSSSNKRVTTYFRTSFDAASPAQYSALSLELLRDDGAIVYLNGVEVARSNMPAGTIGFTTLAASNVAASAERTYFQYIIPVSALATGRNVLAVELHQADVTSYDSSFDLRLKGTLRSSLSPSALTDESSTPRLSTAAVSETESSSQPWGEPPAGPGRSRLPAANENNNCHRLSQSELASRRHAPTRRAIDEVMSLWS